MNLITFNIKDSLLKKKKFKKNSILIGDWCDVPNNIFQYKNNYRIATNVYKYHNNYLKKKIEINYIGRVYNKILDNLSLSLNTPPLVCTLLLPGLSKVALSLPKNGS